MRQSYHDDEYEDTYQHFEFVTIERPLTYQQLHELTDLVHRTSFAPTPRRWSQALPTLTPTSFVYTVSNGVFHCDTQEWMRRFFDAHIFDDQFLRRLMLRLPHHALSQTLLARFVHPAPSGIIPAEHAAPRTPAFHVSAFEQHWLLDWTFDSDPDTDIFEGNPVRWLAQLLPLYYELLQGDTRSLYLGWLANASTRHQYEGETSGSEPELSLAGQKLTPPQLALAEFLSIDPYWLLAAKQPSSTCRSVAELAACAIALEVNHRQTHGVGEAERRARKAIEASRQKMHSEKK